MVADDPESFADLDGHSGINFGLTNVLGADPDSSGNNCGLDAYCLTQQASGESGTPGAATAQQASGSNGTAAQQQPQDLSRAWLVSN
jgi:hypothetical protein